MAERSGTIKKLGIAMSNMVLKNDSASVGSKPEGALQFGEGRKVQQVASMRILLADDHGMVRDVMSSYLETVGRAAIVAVEDYTEAMKVLSNKGPFDLVLLDFSMPG